MTAYALTFGGLLLLGGRVSDLFGRRRLLVAGVSVFVAASLTGGLAESGAWLIVARAVQGVAAAAVAPAVLSLVTTTFPEGPRRDRALGVYAAVSASGFAAGVLLGGVLTEWLGWRWVMFVNVPIGLAVAVFAPRLLPESITDRGRLDVLGAVTVTAGMGCLVYAVTQASSAGWASAQTVGLLAAAVVLLAGFVVWEKRSAEPLVRLGIFRLRNLTSANALAVVQGMVLAPTLYVITLYLQNTLRYSPLTTGLAFLPQALIVVGTAQLVARLTGRVGVRPGLIAGTVALAGGVLVLSRITVADQPWTTVQPGLVLVGLGVAFLIVNVSVAATAGVADSEQGLASGLYNTGQQIGSALGLAFVVAVVAATAAPNPAGPVQGFRVALLTTAGFAIVGLAVAVVVVRDPRRSAAALDPDGPADPASRSRGTS